ncbi:hypothetical protein M3Y94_00092400 [Aphelenchoides besseyi]|nr:hypothetical protein M3Y94_00092400 [Aphelenchoides besseyi]
MRKMQSHIELNKLDLETHESVPLLYADRETKFTELSAKAEAVAILLLKTFPAFTNLVNELRVLILMSREEFEQIVDSVAFVFHKHWEFLRQRMSESELRENRALAFRSKFVELQEIANGMSRSNAVSPDLNVFVDPTIMEQVGPQEEREIESLYEQLDSVLNQIKQKHEQNSQSF